MPKKNKLKNKKLPDNILKPWFENRFFKPLSMALIIITGFIIYSNTFENSFHFDDISSIVDNTAIKRLSNVKAIWDIQFTRFITYYSFALNYHFHRLDLFGYHLVNIIIHISSSLSVWWLILLTLKTPAIKRLKIKFPAAVIALLGGLIFVSHPVQTQGVTYIVQRLASLTALFYFISLGCYIQARLIWQNNEHKIISFPFFVLSLSFAIMSMLSKETGFTLPIIIIIYEIFFMNSKEEFNWKFLPALIVPAAITIPVIYKYRSCFDQLSKVQVPGGLLKLTPIDYLCTQFSVIITYIRLLFLPVNQTIDYDFPLSHGFSNSATVISFIILAAILITGMILYRSFRPISFAIFFFFITLAPESSIIPIRDVIFEHRLYLPMAGFCIFLSFLPYFLFTGNNKRIIPFIFIPVILSFCYLTYNRNLVWKDEFTLWSDAIIKSPGKSRPYCARAKGYLEKKDYINAINDCNNALKIDPTNEHAYTNRGAAYGYLKKDQKAIADFSHAIELNPYKSDSLINRAKLYRQLKKYSLALQDLNQAEKHDCKNDVIYHEKGMVLQRLNKYDKALKNLSMAVQLNPHRSEYFFTRGHYYFLKKDMDRALDDFNQALILNPDHIESLNNRGIIYYKRGNYMRAVEDFSKAVSIAPGHAKAYNNRGLAYFSLNRFKKALSDIETAIRLGAKVNPDLYSRIKDRTHH